MPPSNMHQTSARAPSPILNPSRPAGRAQFTPLRPQHSLPPQPATVMVAEPPSAVARQQG
jgi:hypothetical protein